MSLSQHLKTQIDRITQLHELLQKEQQLLGEGSISGEQLKAIAQDKQSLQQQIEAAEQQRLNAQHKLGFSKDATGARAAAKQAGCEAIWQELMNAAERTARLNTLNGELIAHRLHHNQHMLNILRDAAGDGGLYSASGQQQSALSRLNSKA